MNRCYEFGSDSINEDQERIPNFVVAYKLAVLPG